MRSLRIALVLVVIAGLVTAQRFGVFEQLGDRERLSQTIVGLGPWGYLAFIVSFAAFQPFGIPGTVFVIAASLLWPWPIAFGLSMTGTMLSSVIGFSFARFVARDWLSSIVPARFRKYDDALARRAFTTVVLLRLVFWMQPLLHAFFGVSKVPFRTHFWGSFVGYLVPLFLVSYFGQKLFDAMKNAPLGVWVALAAAATLIGLVLWRVRRRR